LERDLTRCEKRCKIRIVYPALNIGFYRATTAGEKPFLDRATPNSEHIFGDFCYAFQDVVQKMRPDITVFTYDVELYRPLYVAYDTMIREDRAGNLPGDHGVVVDGCVASAEWLANVLSKRRQELIDSGEADPSVRLVRTPPDRLPGHVIVIDDVVYMIASYGIPIWDGQRFVPIEKEDKPADLITWRREDSALASLIVAHLEKLRSSLVSPPPPPPPPPPPTPAGLPGKGEAGSGGDGGDGSGAARAKAGAQEVLKSAPNGADAKDEK
jgi:hypothetical protein